MPGDWIGEDNPVRVIDVFVEELDLAELPDQNCYASTLPAKRFYATKTQSRRQRLFEYFTAASPP